LEADSLRKIYNRLERNVLMFIILPIPLFGFVYLNSQNPIFYFDIPHISAFWEYLGLGLVFLLLVAQYIFFQTTIKKIRLFDANLEARLEFYADACIKRFTLLFIITLVAAVGLFLFENAGYTIAFAICLFFFSIAKPSPDRLISSLKLKGEEKNRVNDLKRRE
jgi:hypothetical protein